MIMEDYKSSEMLRDFQKQSTKEIEMKSNVAILVEATNFETFGVRQVISRNKNKFSGLALNYRNLLKSGKSLTNIKKRMNDALLDDSYIVVTSPRHKMSTSFFSLLNLNEDGVENLKIVKFLCDNHHFLLSNALALVGGYVNSNSAQSTIYSAFKSSKTDYLNSIPQNLSKLRIRAFLRNSIHAMQFEQKNLEEIIRDIELSI